MNINKDRRTSNSIIIERDKLIGSYSKSQPGAQGQNANAAKVSRTLCLLKADGSRPEKSVVGPFGQRPL